MKITKKQQYGILLVLYLCRSGRATTEQMCVGLGISDFFAKQILRILCKAEIVSSTRGRFGGYEVSGEPTVGEVLMALGSVSFLTSRDFSLYRQGAPEHRAFAQFVLSMRSALGIVMACKVRNVGQELVVNELAMLDRSYVGQLEGGN